jgi:hypothetical protein
LRGEALGEPPQGSRSFFAEPYWGRVSRKKERLTQRRPFRLRRSRKNVETPA